MVPIDVLQRQVYPCISSSKEDMRPRPRPCPWSKRRQNTTQIICIAWLLLLRPGGVVVERYAYGPYGQRLVLNPDGSLKEGAAIQNYGFTGRELDGETGLWYFRARYFDDGLRRFIGRDPLGYVDGKSMYRGYFVPWGLDPSGMCVLGEKECEFTSAHISAIEFVVKTMGRHFNNTRKIGMNLLRQGGNQVVSLVIS